MPPTTLFVCPTTHIDWDWVTDFEQYHTIGNYGSTNPVAHTFDRMFDLLHHEPGFVFNLAEMGYFRRYFLDNRRPQDVLAAGSRLALMGGGVTSPDNLLSHGEAFIRNYLVGTRWLASQGISSARMPLSWLPDDFGHDPQLPIALAAMGITAVAFSRVPGSPQGSPNVTPLDGGPTVAASLATTGLVFPWIAADGSQVLAHFMPDTYSVSTADLTQFVTTYSTDAWGGTNMFVPVPSGDFATPTRAILDAITAYNAAPQDGVSAQAGTFADFVAAVLTTPEDLPPAMTLQASNYWCGQFASRPQLKIDHHAAVHSLLAAEVALSLLQAASHLSRSTLDALNGTIEELWWAVSATTHHDFITGTAPDQTYRLEQLPLSAQTRVLARAARDRAVHLLASTIQPGTTGGLPYMVYNALGFARGGLVEVRDLPQSIASVTGAGSTTVQRGADGALLLVAPEVPSFGYATVVLQPGTYTPPSIPSLGDSVTWNNGLVAVTLSANVGWAITSLIDLASKTDVASGTIGALWIYQDTGNLYQFGNEPISDNGSQTGTFSAQRQLTTVQSATLTESGPLRWRLEVTLKDTTGEQYDVTTTLQAGETFVRISVSGKAPNDQSAVVVTSAVADTNGMLPDGLTHGTPHHWNDVLPVRYWAGPTFQATHDYLLPTVGGTAIAAFYHAGMPAWCLDQGDADGQGAGAILGVALRSADGTDRGAAGTDPDRHTQHFAVGVPGAAGLDPTTCVPLQNGTGFANPLIAHPLQTTTALERTLGPTLSLAGVTDGVGMLRAARPQQGSAGVPTPTNSGSQTPPFSVVLRAYTPTNTAETLTIELPAFTTAPTATIVTALELPPELGGLGQPVNTATQPSAAPNPTMTLTMGGALASVQLVGSRVFVMPNNGK